MHSANTGLQVTLYNGIQQNNIQHVISNSANAKGHLGFVTKSLNCDFMHQSLVFVCSVSLILMSFY